MSTTRFLVKEHTLPTSHIREYARATADGQEDELHLAIKQYTPLDVYAPTRNGVTIIGAHANGFPKELYEPLWDELYDTLKAKGIYIRSIWIADVAHQGSSGVLNEDKLGNDPSWMDHPRDLFLMVNHFKKSMKRPLIGIGHSMGGNNLVNLSIMHPRLFTTLILIDPVIQRYSFNKGSSGPARSSTVRRDRWPSKAAAEAAFKRSKMFQVWDPRVLDKWFRYGLRELPTPLYPMPNVSSLLPAVSADPSTASAPPDKNTERELTLTTTRDQEVFSFLRANFSTAEFPSPSSDPNPETHPDIDTGAPSNAPFYRPEPISTFPKLQHLRPSTFYVFGGKSELSAPVLKADMLAHTGTGVGGSGGVNKGRVGEVTFQDIGHLIPMEVVGRTADACAGWIAPELERWRKLEEAERIEWAKVPKHLRSRMSDEFREMMLGDWTKGASQGQAPKATKL